MEKIFIGLAILLGVSSVAMAILYLLYKVDKNEMYPTYNDITYDHIEEDIETAIKRKKRKITNAKRKTYKKPS